MSNIEKVEMLRGLAAEKERGNRLNNAERIPFQLGLNYSTLQPLIQSPIILTSTRFRRRPSNSP
jgi:hypothetical protein